ncbi:EF-1 guanine nucleotide exchange domain-containing protein [Globomyces pollinis-pini]|nr:EF-1 guanine nucleotide exchange domain-containing protein [Globomyces pollinis-pini]
MGFSALNTDAGLQVLDSYLLERSYIEGFVPTQADVAVFEAVQKAPASKYVNALRWYNHIASYTVAESKKFIGVKKAAHEYGPAGSAAPAKAAPAKAAAASAKPAAKEEEDDEDLDLFGSDEEEDEENEKLKAQRVAEYNARKAAKGPLPDAKSMVVFDVKPWDDETDMEALQKQVIAIKMDGLVWGAKKFVPIGYGIKKLSITAVIVDSKVSTDDLIDQIMEFEDYVQSVDIASFNKL